MSKKITRLGIYEVRFTNCYTVNRESPPKPGKNQS